MYPSSSSPPHRLLFISSALLLLGCAWGATSYYPSSITDTTSTHSTDQPISVLAKQDQSGTQNTWNNYIEFDSISAAYSGIFNFNIGSALSISAITLTVNYLGQSWSFQQWTFEIYLNAKGTTAASWVKIGDTSSDTTGWNSWKLLTFTPSASTVDFTRILSSTNQIQIRFSSNKVYDDCDIDFVQLAITSSASSTSATASTSSSTSSTAAATTATATTTTTATKSTSTTSTTAASTSTTAASSSTTASTSTTATSSTPTPTTTTTTGSSSTTTTVSGITGVTNNVVLKILILTSSTSAAGLDFAKLAFDSVGMPYDVVTISTSSSLSSYLATSGTGKYCGIVTITKLLSSTQKSAVTAYQVSYGVKLVVVGSNPSGLTGLTPGSTTSSLGTITLASAFSQWAGMMNPSASVDTASQINWVGLNTASVTPATITNPSVAIPALMIKIGSGSPQVAAAQITTASNTFELHYFVDEAAAYIHSRAFAPILTNWIAPGQVFQGARRLTFLVQCDDLFLASNLWDVNTHTNPLSDNLIYRMTNTDLQNIANYYDSLNPTLPSGSYVTVEWPFNGAGTTWYISPDTLESAATSLQNKFYFLSHTWDHPCDLDTASYAEMQSELVQNIQFTPSFLTGGLANPRMSNNSMVNPCITGLFNANVLKAMVDYGIVNCVGDNSVAALVPPNLYHGIATTVATNGYAGVFIVPRQDLDIDYDTSLPNEVVDEYHTMYGGNLAFEDIMTIQLAYGLEVTTAFRHDPFMMHQANGRSFTYADPVAGTTRTISLLTLFTDRVVNKLKSIWSLPIVAPKMSDLATMVRTRTSQDACGFQATLQISNSQIIGVQASSTGSCLAGISGLRLSGSTVTIETSGTEVTSWIQMTAGVTQTLSLVTPIHL